jgi:hypothetical protein
MSKSLKQNALSIVDTIALAVAGTAPSYSLNATTAALGHYSMAQCQCLGSPSLLSI